MTVSITSVYSGIRSSKSLLGLAVGLREAGINSRHVIIDSVIPELHVDLDAEGFNPIFISKGSKRNSLKTVADLKDAINPLTSPHHVVSHGLYGSLSTAMATYTSGNFHSYFRHFGFPIKRTILSRSELYGEICHRTADSTVVASESMFQAMSKRVPQSKLTKLYYGIDTTMFSPFDSYYRRSCRERYGIPKSSVVIGIVSRWEKWKGLQYSLPALRDLISEGYPLHIMLANAHGPFADPVEHELSYFPVGTVTKFPYTGAMNDFYAAIDINVHVPITATVEAFGLTTIEAMMSGIPGVYTPSGVAAEVVHDRETGLLVPFRNKKSICEGLRELIEDSELRSRLGRAAHERVGHMDLKGMTDSWVRYLREIN